VPGKSKIELMPHKVRTDANSLRTSCEAGSLVASEIAEEQLRIATNTPAHFKAAINRIERCICWRHDNVIADKRQEVPVVRITQAHPQLPKPRKLPVHSTVHSIGYRPEKNSAAAAQKVAVAGADPDVPLELVPDHAVNSPGNTSTRRKKSGTGQRSIMNKGDFRSRAYLTGIALYHRSLKR
jgi:hypothetical protein